MADIAPGTGKVILDGTSYSGADIKAVVHVYRDATEAISEAREQIEALTRQLEATTDSNAKADILQQIQNVQGQIKDFEKETQVLTTKVLAEAQTITVSTYREKYPVRALSTVYPKGITRGPRTVAGSIVFTVFDKNVLYEILAADPTEFDSDKIFSSILIDQLPPLDITISFANEMGQESTMVVYGIDFVSEGQTMSIHDLFIENQVQFIARDVDPMRRTGDSRRKVLTPGTKLASDLLREPAAREYALSNDPFERFRNRNTPFK
jgi:hypothetical protein